MEVPKNFKDLRKLGVRTQPRSQGFSLFPEVGTNSLAQYRSVWPPEKLSLALVPRSYVLRMISDLIICAIYPHSIGWILTRRQWIWGCGSYPYPHKTWHRTSSQRSTFSIRVQFTEARRRGLWKVWFFDYCDRQDITRLCEWILHGRRQDSCWELGHRVEARGFELWRSRGAL